MKKKNETKENTENTETRKTTYWPYRPGFNWLLGYTEGKPVQTQGGGLKVGSITLPEREDDLPLPGGLLQ